MQVIGRKQFQTKAGVIEGIEFDTCYELRGVRYATAQRWTAPKMVKNWMVFMMRQNMENDVFNITGRWMNFMEKNFIQIRRLRFQNRKIAYL